MSRRTVVKVCGLTQRDDAAWALAWPLPRVRAAEDLDAILGAARFEHETALRSALVAFLGSVMTGVRRWGMPS